MATTTTATTATSTTTSTAATKSAAQSAASGLLKSLGTGSDIDMGSLVPALVDAQFAGKKAQLAKKQETVGAQISGISTLKSTITQFSKAFETLVKGGTLSTQPVSSTPGTLTATATPGAQIAGKTATVTVTKLALGQSAVSKDPFTKASDPVGTGTLTLTVGTGSYDTDGKLTGVTGTPLSIAIGENDKSLTGIAAAINAKKAGVTASIVTDAEGKAYLSLRGTTGAANAFTLTGSTPELAQLDVGPGATNTNITQTARNAELTVDGVAIQRASNEISDAIDGMKLNLVAPSSTPVTLTTSTPTAALTTAVKDFADTYNEVLGILKEQTDPVTGSLRNDPATRQLTNMLRSMTSKVLLPNAGTGEPATLAAIGLRTKRDGTLEVDETALNAALQNSPRAVEAMFSVSTTSETGLYAAMQSLQFNASSFVYGLGASGQRYSTAKSDLAKVETKLTEAADKLTTRMTAQFSAMNSRVSAFKATQAYLKQQVDMWTKSS